MGFPVSQGEREQTARARARPVPAAAFNAAFLACLREPPRRRCRVWKGSALAQLVGVCRGRRAVRLPPQAPHVLGQPSVPFRFNGGCREPAGRLLRGPRLFTAATSGFGGPVSAPSCDSEADAGPSCCPKGERALGEGGRVVFNEIQFEKKKIKLFFFFFLANSHRNTPIAQPKPYRFLWTKQVGWPSPRGPGEKRQQQPPPPPWLRGGSCFPVRARLRGQPRGEGRGREEGEGTGARKGDPEGAGCSSHSSPEVAEGEGLWRPTGPTWVGLTCRPRPGERGSNRTPHDTAERLDGPKASTHRKRSRCATRVWSPHFLGFSLCCPVTRGSDTH